MLQRGAGKIIFTASLLSFQGGITVPGYAAAKSGIAGLTRALANEWAGARRQRQRHRARLHRHRQHRRRCATTRTATAPSSTASRPAAGARPTTSAGATVFLASRAADYVHGTILAVDGGWLAR